MAARIIEYADVERLIRGARLDTEPVNALYPGQGVHLPARMHELLDFMVECMRVE